MAQAGQPASQQLLQIRIHVHLLIGPRQPIRPGILRALPGYLRGFWYLDQVGVNMTSSLPRRALRPDQIDAKVARFFINGVTAWNLRRGPKRWLERQKSARLGGIIDMRYCDGPPY